MAESTAHAVLEIDLDAVASNINLLQSRAPNAQMSGVVKANAYGIGLAEITGVHKALGTKTFFVATPDEGIALRAILGPGFEIIVLGGLFAGAEGVYHDHALTPVINTLADVERLRPGQESVLHIDTGMSRLGLDGADTKKILEDPAILRAANITMVMSHFACADEVGHPLTEQQFKAFSAFATLFPGARKSLSNSSGIFASKAYHFDMVRPGMAVYGLNPIPEQSSPQSNPQSNPMRPVVQLRARILQIREVAAGASVGYGASYRCATPHRIATVALGYADGFLRSLGNNNGRLFWRGQACPILGRVSMDLVTLDVTDVVGDPPRAGAWVDVLGPGQDADALAHSAGTIGYEILTGLGSRYARLYRGGKPFDNKGVSG